MTYAGGRRPVVRIGPGVVRLGITAERNVQIVRGELSDVWFDRKTLGSDRYAHRLADGPLDSDLSCIQVAEASGDVGEVV